MGITSKTYEECVRESNRYCRVECSDRGEVFYVRWMREDEAIKTKASLEGHGATIRIFFINTLIYGQ